MRILLIGNRFGCAMLVELIEYKLIVLTIDIRVELAVGESTGTALAKLHVGVGIQHFGLQKTLHRLLAFLNAFATLDNDGMSTATGQVKGGEHARRSETDHHGRQIMRPLGIGNFLCRCGLHSIGTLQQGTVLVGDGNLHLKIVQHIVLLPRIHRLPHDTESVQVFRANMELLANQVFQVLLTPNRNFYIRQFKLYHFSTFSSILWLFRCSASVFRSQKTPSE